MRISKNNDLKVILHVVSVNLNIPLKDVENIFASYYKELNEVLSTQKREDILNFKTIRIPNFGKLYLTDAKKIKIKESLKNNGEKSKT